MGLRRDSSFAGRAGIDDCVYYTDRDLQYQIRDIQEAGNH
jgi:hypothetical protein